LHDERKKWYGMVQAGNLRTKRSEGGKERGRCRLCAEGEKESQLLLKCPETRICRQEILNSKRPHTKDEIALRKILTAKNVTEDRNLGTLAYKVKCECENRVKKAELSFGNEQEREVQ
jgi:hypothetical protein